MSSKINISDIFSDHFATMRSEKTNKISRADMATFFFLPFCFAIMAFAFGLRLNKEAITVIIASLSIFAALLVNVLMIIYSISEKQTDAVGSTSPDKSDLMLRFIREVFSNVSYSIVVAMMAIVLLVVLVFLSGIWAEIFTAVVVFLVGNFLLTLVMALKRIHVLLHEKFG